MKLGSKGELIAQEYLEQEGYEILEKNFRYRSGEIDLIGRKNGLLIFIEVKTRKNTKYGLPRESVDFFKQRQIYQTAKMFLRKKDLYDALIRFDVVEVYYEDSVKIIHIPNAFDGNDVEV